jgi:hypothetical protein
MTDNEKLIEDARALERDWGQNEGDAIDIARRLADALESAEKAYTPTDDEREALAIVQGAKDAYLEAYPGDNHAERFAALDRLAAGFRRSEPQGEPSDATRIVFEVLREDHGGSMNVTYLSRLAASIVEALRAAGGEGL